MFSQMTNRQLSIVSPRNLVVQTVERKREVFQYSVEKTALSHSCCYFVLMGGGGINLVALSVFFFWGGGAVVGFVVFTITVDDLQKTVVHRYLKIVKRNSMQG